MKHLLQTLLLFCAYISSANSNPLAGSWHAELEGQVLNITFGANGQGSMNDAPITYQTLGGLLLIDNAGKVFAYQFERKGNRLTVVGGDLDGPLVLTQGSRVASAPKKGSSGSTMNQSTTRGQELIGKWCLLTSFSATGGGGSQSSTCFELRPDGSYDFASERSMSAYGGGMYGGTASSNSDSGRWQFADNLLKTQSYTGRSQEYRVEKRNHPKNRDPMICIDGDCYVSYWQKAPW